MTLWCFIGGFLCFVVGLLFGWAKGVAAEPMTLKSRWTEHRPDGEGG